MQREQKRPPRFWVWWPSPKMLAPMLLTLAVSLSPSSKMLAAKLEIEADSSAVVAGESADQEEKNAATQKGKTEDSKPAEKKADAETEEAETAEKKEEVQESPAEGEPTAEGSEQNQEKREEKATGGSKEDSTSKQAGQEANKSPTKKTEPAEKEDGTKKEKTKAGKSTSKPEVEQERPLEVDQPKGETPKKKQAGPLHEVKNSERKKCVIGATATLLEKQSELKFRARVDSGAKSCSLHFEEIKIEGGSKKENITERMTENIGKVIHFKVKNGDGKTHILTSKIAGYVIIKTSNKKEGKRRYKVPLTFLWKNMEKEVLVTLNNRGHLDYPLLLGRNFLRGDFLVDVEMNSDD